MLLDKSLATMTSALLCSILAVAASVLKKLGTSAWDDGGNGATGGQLPSNLLNCVLYVAMRCLFGDRFDISPF